MNSLYILPFDHRSSFFKMVSVDGDQLTPEIIEQLRDYRHLVYEGFLQAIKMGAPKQSAAFLTDEQFGARILEEAKTAGITCILTTEKSGQDEFDFEYGEDFRAHIDKFKPDYVKVLVRYNPGGDQELNKRQTTRLKQMSDFCHGNGYKFLFELLVPATAEQKKECQDTGQDYDTTIRYLGMLGAIDELQDAGVEPDIWKIEGLESFDQMSAVINKTRSSGRDKVGVVVLGRGESEEKVRIWLTVAAKIPGVAGFAVGRTVFKQPMLEFAQKKITREQAVSQVARNYKSFVDLFESAAGSA